MFCAHCSSSPLSLFLSIPSENLRNKEDKLLNQLLILHIMQELQRAIEKGESETVELKESLSLKNEIGETVSAFSNTNKGTIIIGVSDSGSIIGVEVGKKTLEGLANYIKQNTDNHIYPKIIVRSIDDKNLIIIAINEANEKPVFFRGNAYRRISKSNHKMSASEIRKLAKESGKKIYWDEQVCEGVGLEEIDNDKVKWFLEKRQIIRGKNKYGGMSWHQLLMNIGAISKNLKPTNAGILIFGNTPQKFIDVSEVRCARFKGNAMKEFIDSVDLKGSIFEMAESAMKFIERNIRTASRVVGIMSQYKREYPLDALREAIINAIIHRDYMLNSNVRIAIFDDRIEIISPGGLMPGLTIDKLEGTHELRNKKLAKYFYEIGEIEKWGSGIIKMNMLMKQYGLNKPKYESNHQFKVIFYGPCEDILDLIKKPSEIIELNERQKKALEYIKKYGSITNGRFRNLFSVTDRTALRDLDDLVTKNILKRVGKRRAARYELK